MVTNEIKTKSNNSMNENENKMETKHLPKLNKKNTTTPNNKTVANQMIECFCEKKSKRLQHFGTCGLLTFYI